VQETGTGEKQTTNTLEPVIVARIRLLPGVTKMTSFISALFAPNKIQTIKCWLCLKLCGNQIDELTYQNEILQHRIVTLIDVINKDDDTIKQAVEAVREADNVIG